MTYYYMLHVFFNFYLLNLYRVITTQISTLSLLIGKSQFNKKVALLIRKKKCDSNRKHSQNTHKSNNRCTCIMYMYMYTGHFQRWKKERKVIAFFDTAIPPCSQWPSLSGKLHVSKIRGVQLNSKKSIIFCKKWLGGYVYPLNKNYVLCII